jgi:signal transduction histidine kinase
LHEEEKKLESLKTEKEHAEETNRAKSMFLSNMSHEFGTPINVILGFVDIQAIAVATQLTPDEISSGLKAGFDQVLIKPLPMDRLKRLIRFSLPALTMTVLINAVFWGKTLIQRLPSGGFKNVFNAH